jgi:hypothetical protein
VSFEYQNFNIYFNGFGRGSTNRLTAMSWTFTGRNESRIEKEMKELEKREAGHKFREHGSRSVETTGKNKRQRPDEKRRTETVREEKIG